MKRATGGSPSAASPVHWFDDAALQLHRAVLAIRSCGHLWRYFLTARLNLKAARSRRPVDPVVLLAVAKTGSLHAAGPEFDVESPMASPRQRRQSRLSSQL